MLKDHTTLFKEFMDNPNFKRWLTDTLFNLTCNWRRPELYASSCGDQKTKDQCAHDRNLTRPLSPSCEATHSWKYPLTPN